MGFVFQLKHAKKRVKLLIVAAHLSASFDAFQKGAHRSSCICFQNRCAKTNSLQLKHVESHVFRQSRQILHSTLFVRNEVVMETSTCFHLSIGGCKNTSKLKTLSHLPVRLLWFEIKPSSSISNQLQLKRLSSKTMSSYMTSSVLFNQMPLIGLWCKENADSSFDHVILHEMISSAQPYRSQ